MSFIAQLAARLLDSVSRPILIGLAGLAGKLRAPVGAAFDFAATGVSKLIGAFKNDAARAAKFGRGLDNVATAIDEIGDNPLVKLATGAAETGASYVKARIDYARQRRTQGLAASGADTSSQRIDELTRRFESMSLTREDAEKSLEEFSRVVDSSINETGKGPDELARLGITSVDEYDKRLDKAAMLMRLQERLADIYKRNGELRAKMEADKSAGKDVSQDDVAEVGAGEKIVSETSRKFGFNNKIAGGIKQSGGSANMIGKTNAVIARRGTIDPKDDANTIALINDADAVGDASFGRVGDAGNQKGVDLLRSSFSKARLEVEAALEALRAAGMISKAEAQDTSIPGSRSAKSNEPNPYGSPYSQNAQKSTTNAFGTLWQSNSVKSRDIFGSFGTLGAVNNPPASNMTTINIGVTAGASAPEIADTVKKVVEGMAAFQKTSNSWTSGSVKP